MTAVHGTPSGVDETPLKNRRTKTKIADRRFSFAAPQGYFQEFLMGGRERGV